MVKTEADYLEELIAFPSVSTNKEASKECAEFCAGFFEGRGLNTKMIESNGFPNVIATSKKSKSPNILLQAHMDVVPAKGDLFTMQRKGGKLIGRGAFDMKFACASYMKLVDELENIKKYDFGIMLSFDEEIGGQNGVRALLDQGYDAKVCILPDSGHDWHLEASAHGAWFLKLTKHGKNAHASMPECGINSAEILIEAISEINKLCDRHSKSDLALSLTKINSGDAMNQIPDYGEVILDIRFRNKKILADLKDKVEDICKRLEIRFETIVLADCMDVDPEKSEVVNFLKIAERTIGRKISTGHSLGTTDARYFCAKNIPCIVIQPNGGGRHSDNEWVDNEGLQNLTKILYRYIKECAII